MQEAIKLVTEFFIANNFHESLKAMRTELLESIPQEPSQQLLKVIDNISLTDNVQRPSEKHKTQKQPPPTNRRYSQEKADSIMEGLMTRIANNPNLLNDSNLNRRIQNVMENRVFLKLVENT